MSATFSIPGIIEKTRDSQQLSKGEIQYFVDALVNNTAQPAQIGAWLMAATLNGLSKEASIHLTECMMRSGEVMTWPEEWRGRMVDKHSTGGVGDKVSLVLAPALAACGMKVPMISGRGLAHTGGTLDKLEGIPGYSVSVTKERMREILDSVGCCIVGQTTSLVPADKILYATRDVTGTVKNRQLITASIISKKAAEGLDSLVLDVKTGNGALMDKQEDAEALATQMVEVGCGLNIKTAAIISSMDCPLGRAVGNSLEVAESVHCLQGKGPDDLLDIVVQIGGLNLYLAGKVSSREQGSRMIQDVIADRSALAKFQDMIIAQGASPDDATALCDINGDVWKILKASKYSTTLTCPQSGVVQAIKAMPCAYTAHALGAGRSKAGEAIDTSVGLYLLVSLGDQVSEGTPWVRVHHSTPQLPEHCRNLLSEVLVIVPQLTSPIPASRVLKVIDPCL